MQTLLLSCIMGLVYDQFSESQQYWPSVLSILIMPNKATQWSIRLLAGGLCMLSMSYYQYYLYKLQQSAAHISHMLDTQQACVVQIQSIPIRKHKYLNYKANIQTCGGYKPQVQLFLSIRSPKQDLHLGDVLYFNSRHIRYTPCQLSTELNPRRFRSNRIITQVTIDKKAHLHHIHSTSIDSFATWLRATVCKHIMANTPLSPLSLALLVGEQSHISMQQWQILKHSGTAHLIAISGLHIGLLLRMLQALILRLIYRWCIINPFIISACISTSILLLYAMIAGMSPSCLRAVTMAVMRCMQLMHYQRSHTLQNALICFILHAIIKPEHIAQIGFQLSYGMVISLLWLPKLLPTALKPYERWLSTPIISAFWSYAYWQNITLSAPLANSIAIPWVSYILLPLTLLASCLGILHQASGVYLHQCIDFQWHFLFTILKNLNAYLPCLDLSSKQ